MCERMKTVALPCAGFHSGIATRMKDRTDAYCVRISATEGRYIIRVNITASQDTKEALLFANKRRLIWRGDLRSGETISVSALCMVHPLLPGTTDVPLQGKDIELALIAPGACIDAVCAAPANVPAVLLMGDSTVTDQEALSPYAPGATYCGWGQMLPAYLGENACVGNFAHSGLTVETFRTEGYYDLMKTMLLPGDFVLMQFGHNDQKRSHLTAEGGYAEGLRAYIAELRTLGAKPVLVTPLARNSWKNEETYLDLLSAFAQSAKAVAAEMGVPLIDLHGFMKAHLLRTGRDAAKTLFHIGDYTHTNDFGANLAADFVAAELARLGLMRVNACAPWPPHGPYDVPASDQGDEALPPTGLEVLYRSYEQDRPSAPLTRQEALELICRTCSLFAHNAPIDLPSDVPLDEPYSPDIRCALQHGIIPADMLADGKFHRWREISGEDFMRILSLGYGMRCHAENLPKLTGETITRERAAAICRAAQI